MRSLDRGMERHYGRKKVLKFGFFPRHFIVCYKLPLVLKHVKLMFIYLLHSNYDHENLAIVYPPLKFAHAYPHYVTDFDKNIPSKPCDNHDQVDEPHEAKADISPPILGPTSSKTQNRYIPLKLP